MKPITHPQIKKIFALSKLARMDEEELRDLVMSVTGSESIKALTLQQGVAVIDRLSKVAGQVGGGVSPRQRFLIEQLATELGWKNDPRRLRRFLEKQQGVSHPSFLNPKQASRVIEALKSMKRQAKGGSRDGESAEPLHSGTTKCD